MSSPPTSPSPTILSAFTPLRGGYNQSIAPGSQLVTFLGEGAAWWEGDEPVTVTLPTGTPTDGARFTADGKSMRVGLGTLDLATRAWRAEPTLEPWRRPGPGGFMAVRQVAWFADATHVALLHEKRDAAGARTQEIIIVSAADGSVRGRRAVEVARAMVASEDRLLVAANEVLLLDLDTNLVTKPASMPDSVTRVTQGGGMFAAVGAAGAVALIRPSDGTVLATWNERVFDAVPVERGVVTVDAEGVVRVGCFDGAGLRKVAEVPSGASGGIVIQRVGDRIVVASRDVRVATFANPCR